MPRGAGTLSGPHEAALGARGETGIGFRAPRSSRHILTVKHSGRSDRSLRALTAHPDVSPSERLGVTASFAVLIHLIVILGVTFVPEDPPERHVEKLDVLLVPLRTEAVPDRPDHLAQRNLDGGGDGTGETPPETPRATPLAAGEPPMAAAELAMPLFDAPPRPARGSAGPRVAARPAQADTGRATDAPSGDPDPVSASGVPVAAREVDTATSISRSHEIAVLSAEIERKLRAYAERPRRKWISARTREHEFAAYMDAWRRKVERIGNLNYPDEAVRRGLSGDLLLEVSLNTDGTIEDIALRRSSGHRILDDAAVHIVQLAAPFSRFPEGIAKAVDILHIERTWIFHSPNRFAIP